MGFRPMMRMSCLIKAVLGLDLVCVFETEEQVRNLTPDQELLKQIEGRIQNATARGTETDWSAIIKVESENSPKYGRIGRHRKVRKMATYEKSFKEEAVKLSDEIGIKKAAAQLGVPYYTLADWRHRQNIHGDQAHVGSGHKRETGDEKDRRIRELERENAELARANEILQEALGFFAKNRKK